MPVAGLLCESRSKMYQDEDRKREDKSEGTRLPTPRLVPQGERDFPAVSLLSSTPPLGHGSPWLSLAWYMIPPPCGTQSSVIHTYDFSPFTLPDTRQLYVSLVVIGR